MKMKQLLFRQLALCCASSSLWIFSVDEKTAITEKNLKNSGKCLIFIFRVYYLTTLLYH